MSNIQQRDGGEHHQFLVLEPRHQFSPSHPFHPLILPSDAG